MMPPRYIARRGTANNRAGDDMRKSFGLFCVAMAAFISAAQAAEPALTVTVGERVQTFTAAELLARPDAQTITVPNDISYNKTMSFRAVPLLALLGSAPESAFDTIEVRATDGFASQIPLALINNADEGGSVAWMAVEDPAAPWPPLPGKDVSAGPFYLVWQKPELSKVGSEQWPYQVASITAVESPPHRWPQMDVDGSTPQDAPERHGMTVFITQCMPCHRMNGAGAADVGPDLGKPMNPTQYLTPEGLRALIRNPKAVRTWPQQQMPAFDEQKLSAPDLDALVAYLGHMAHKAR
jgi:mono/diheme cytochrome c family protein